jgi:hypothetical protein
MKLSPIKFTFLLLCIPVFLLPLTAQASVSYSFNVSEYPESLFHQPFQAELVVSDEAVDAGVAYLSDIEALTISGGATMPTTAPITMAHLHPAFLNLEILFSEDRNTITTMSAEIAPYMSPTDHWVYYFPNPPSSNLIVHEHLAFLSSHYIRLETTLLPVPPKFYLSYFSGEWQRQSAAFDIGKFISEQIACFPFCPWPWLIILSVILLAIFFGMMRKVNQTHNH